MQDPAPLPWRQPERNESMKAGRKGPRHFAHATLPKSRAVDHDYVARVKAKGRSALGKVVHHSGGESALVGFLATCLAHAAASMCLLLC